MEKKQEEVAEKKESTPTAQNSSSAQNLQPNVAAALCYLVGFISGIFFLLTEKNNRFVRFHAWQSIIFTVAFVVVTWVVGLIPGIGWFLSSLLSLGGFLVWLFLMYKALNNVEYKLPVIGEYAEKYIDTIK